MRPEFFMLQKFEHRGRESLRNAVDFVYKQNALFFALRFDRLVNLGDYFAHRIFRHGIFLTAESPLRYKRQTYRRLTRMMRYRVT